MTQGETGSGETFSSSAILWIVIAAALGVLGVIGIGLAV